MNQLQNGHLYMYVGSYTHKTSTAISVLSMNVHDGTMEVVDHLDGNEHLSFLTIDSEGKYLYAVSETMETQGKAGGKVVSYAIDQETGKLSYLNEQLTKGASPCYLTLDRQRENLFVVNYGGGSVCWFPVDENGKIGQMADQVQHAGSSIQPGRQEAPHPHSIVLDPSDQFAYVSDLGLDKVMIYRLDREYRKFCYVDEVKVHPGAGPRHLVFHPGKPYAFLIHELDSSITVFSHHREGSLQQLQNLSATPESSSNQNWSADIHVDPSGNFLYGSNRGLDNVVIYRINQENGMLTYIGNRSTRGKIPRNFALSPDGGFLIVANQDSDSLITFKINRQTGQLSEPVRKVSVSEPVCIKFLNVGIR